MYKKIVVAILSVCLLFLSACRSTHSELPQDKTPPIQAVEDTVPPADVSMPPDAELSADSNENWRDETDEDILAEPSQPSGSESESQNKPVTKDSIAELFLNAMTTLTTEIQFDVSGMTWEFGASNDLRNIYYALLSENQELKEALNK